MAAEVNIQPMTVEDYLAVMAANKGIWPYYDAWPEERKRFMANLNVLTGTAETVMKDGRIYAVGGIRYSGVGEAWMITAPENRTPMLLRTVTRNFKRLCEQHNLWRVFAEVSLSEDFLTRLDFEKNDNIRVWTRI